MLKHILLLIFGLLLSALPSCKSNTVEIPKNVALITVTNSIQNTSPAFIAYRDGDKPWVLPKAKEMGSYEFVVDNADGIYDFVIICPKTAISSFQSGAFIAATLTDMKTFSMPCLGENISLETFEITGTVSGFDGASSVSVFGGWDVDVNNGKIHRATPDDPNYYIKTPIGLQSFIAIRDSEPKRILVQQDVMIDSDHRLDFDFSQTGYLMESHEITIKNEDFSVFSGLMVKGTSLLFSRC